MMVPKHALIELVDVTADLAARSAGSDMIDDLLMSAMDTRRSYA